MEWQFYIAYVLATTVLILMPGPIVTLVVAQSLKHGTRTGLGTVVGTTTGNALLVTAGAAGLSTVLTLLAGAFDIVRWCGAAYLVYLGIREWRSHARTLDETDAGRRRPFKVLFWQGLLVAVTNPKTILFYVAFFPQFVDPAAPLGPQLALMSVTFVVLAGLFDGLYAVLAGRLRTMFQGERASRLRSRITGTLLIGTGIGLALTRR